MKTASQKLETTRKKKAVAMLQYSKPLDENKKCLFKLDFF
jgi:hypothetical protein